MPPVPLPLARPDRTELVRRAAARFCGQMGWAPVHEMPLPNGRRADIMALRPDGGFACIEVKSDAADFLVDSKWPEYRTFCDALYFAVDENFPLPLLPEETGLIVTAHLEAALLRDAPTHPMPPTRRRTILLRFARLAAVRLATLEDPAGSAGLLAALRAE